MFLTLKFLICLLNFLIFLLVDNNRNIRGVYDGTDMSEVNRLINDIEVLLETIS